MVATVCVGVDWESRLRGVDRFMSCMTKSWSCEVEVKQAEEMQHWCGETSVESNGSYRTSSFSPSFVASVC